MTDSTRPNIVLITTDQQRFDTIGPHKPTFLRTPHIDQLCHEGVRFDRAYADCPICVPSRVSIMSGRSVLSHGMAGNGASSDVLTHDNTLPHHLHQLGYHTAAIGKMHFTPQRDRHGFDEMLIPEDYYRWVERAAYPHGPMRHGMGQCELEPAMSTLPEGLTLTSWTADQSLEYIRHRRDPSRPFFLWTSFSKPHPPFDPPEPYWSMYQHADIPDPAIGDWCENTDAWPEAYREVMLSQYVDTWTPETVRAIRAAYYGLVTHCDYAIGRVLSALQDIGQLDNTLIVFCSDHGEYLGDHKSAGKGYFHEASARIPMVLRLPRTWEHRGHGTTCPSLVSLNDLLPTFVSVAGGRPPQASDGRDLVATFRGEIAPRSCVVSTAGSADNPWHISITDGRHKYCYYPRGGAEQLFDLANDPQENRDLAGDGRTRDVKANLRQLMVDELNRRAPRLAPNNELPHRLAEHATLRELRNRRWAGLHTEYHPHDVRH